MQEREDRLQNLQTTSSDDYFMGVALEEARFAAAEGEVPVGAVVVHCGELVVRAHNRVEGDKSGIAHAELLAIGEASRKLGMWRLDDCVLYVTKEPCPMCTGALLNARVPRLVFGCGDPRTGCAGGFVDLTAMPGAIHRIAVTAGVRGEECRQLIQDFFRQRREENRTKNSGSDNLGTGVVLG